MLLLPLRVIDTFGRMPLFVSQEKHKIVVSYSSVVWVTLMKQEGQKYWVGGLSFPQYKIYFIEICIAYFLVLFFLFYISQFAVFASSYLVWCPSTVVVGCLLCFISLQCLMSLCQSCSSSFWCFTTMETKRGSQSIIGGTTDLCIASFCLFIKLRQMSA